jgi:hypothetical protein
MKALAVRTASILLAVLFFVGSNLQAQTTRVTREYDRFKDQTAVKLEKTLIRGIDGEDGLFLVMTSIYHGKPTGEEAIAINFFLQTPKEHFARPFIDRELIFLADGVRVRLGDVEVVDTKPGAEWIAAATNLVELRSLAGAKKIEGKLGDLEFSFDHDQVSAVHDFMKSLTPARAR